MPRKPVPSRLWNLIQQPAAVPTLQLFGDIGISTDPDWFWGDEGGAGTFKEFCAALAALGNAPEIAVEIHSYGGSVLVGKAMHDRLAQHPAQKTAKIYGVCASAATYPMLACQQIQIAANSFIVIHNSTDVCFGCADDMEHCAENLRICDESIASLYSARTGLSIAEIQAIMDKDTWMTGKDALELGLVTEVIEPITVTTQEQSAPENFRRLLNTMPREAQPWFDMRRVSNLTKPKPSNSIPTMRRPNNAIFNAAENSTGGTGASVSAPAPAAAAAPAPANVVPPPAAVAVPAPAAPDLGTQITNAVGAAIKPLQDEITNLKTRLDQGVTAANLAGAQPAGDVVAPGQLATNEMKRAAWEKLAPKAQNKFVRDGGKLID